VGIDLPNDKDFWRREDRAEFARNFFRLNMSKYKNHPSAQQNDDSNRIYLWWTYSLFVGKRPVF